MILNRYICEAMDILPFFYFIKDLEGKFVWINKKMIDLLGIPREKLIGKKFEDAIPNYPISYIKEYVDNDNKFLVNQKALIGTVEPFESDGYRRFINMNRIPFTQDGDLAGIICVGTDVTDVRETLMEFDLLLHSISDMIIITDYDGTLIKIYPGIIKPYQNPDDLIGKTIKEVFVDHSYITNFFYDGAEKLIKRQTNSVLFQYELEGRMYEVSMSLYNGSKIVNVIRDITNRKKVDVLKRLLDELELSEFELFKSKIS